MARTALLRITDAIDGPLWWWWLPSMCLLPPFDLSSIFYQCITMLEHLYLSQAMSQWLLLVTDPCCDDDSLSCVFFCQSTSLGGTFYLSMYVMICARAIFRALIWLLDFCGVNQNIEILICIPGKTGKYLRAAPDLPVSCCIYDSMWTPVVMIGVARCLRQ